VSIGTISSRFQIVIPKEVRERLDLKRGQRAQAISDRGRVELIQVRPFDDARGFRWQTA
jgi:AbrB family looped-hinge helix DNA binding protein